MEDVTVLVTALNTGHYTIILSGDSGNKTLDIQLVRCDEVKEFECYGQPTFSQPNQQQTFVLHPARQRNLAQSWSPMHFDPSHRTAWQYNKYTNTSLTRILRWKRVAQVRSNIRSHLSVSCLFVSGDRVSAQDKACYNLFHPLIEQRDLQGQTRARGSLRRTARWEHHLPKSLPLAERFRLYRFVYHCFFMHMDYKVR